MLQIQESKKCPAQSSLNFFPYNKDKILWLREDSGNPFIHFPRLPFFPGLFNARKSSWKNNIGAQIYNLCAKKRLLGAPVFISQHHHRVSFLLSFFLLLCFVFSLFLSPRPLSSGRQYWNSNRRVNMHRAEGGERGFTRYIRRWGISYLGDYIIKSEEEDIN